MFDCVLPTRSGRHGQAWTWDGPVNLKNARFAEDDAPLDPDSDCPASRDYSKAYLHHLVKADEILGQVLLSWHNLAFFQALMAGLRAAIAEGRLEAFAPGSRRNAPRVIWSGSGFVACVAGYPASTASITRRWTIPAEVDLGSPGQREHGLPQCPAAGSGPGGGVVRDPGAEGGAGIAVEEVTR